MRRREMENIDKKRSFLDYTFIYNPGYDYKPISHDEILNRSWKRVGKNMRRALVSFASTKESYGA